MAGLLDYLQISLEVQHGYLGVAAFSILVILSLSKVQCRTLFFAEFVVTSNSEGTSRELQQINFPGWELNVHGQHNNSKSVLQPLNGGFLYNDVVLLDCR